MLCWRPGTESNYPTCKGNRVLDGGFEIAITAEEKHGRDWERTLVLP